MRRLFVFTAFCMAGCSDRVCIGYTDHGNQPAIAVEVNGMKTMALIDSGCAGHCVIDEVIARKLGLAKMDNLSVTEQGVSGDSHDGWVSADAVHITMGNVVMDVEHPFVAARPPSIPFPSITIGYVGMKRMRMSFDYEKKLLVLEIPGSEGEATAHRSR